MGQLSKQTYSFVILISYRLNPYIPVSNWLKLIRDQGNKSHTNSDCLVPIVLCLKVCISDPPPPSYVSWSSAQDLTEIQVPRWQMWSCLPLPTQKRMQCMWILKAEPRLDAKLSVHLAWHAMTGKSSERSQRSAHIPKKCWLSKNFFFLFLWRAQDMRFILKSYSFWFLRPFFLTFFF